jgi:hypothetical protein
VTEKDYQYEICNTATVYGYLCHAELTDCDSVCVTVVHPCIDVEKSGCPCVVVEGHPVLWTITVTNCGDVALEDVYVYDEMLGGYFYKVNYTGNGTLGVGEVWTIEIEWTVPYTDLNEQYTIQNCATGYGRLCHGWVDDTGCACIRVVHPDIEVTKWSPYTMMVEEHWVTYYINVTNTGDVELYGVYVYDDLLDQFLYLMDENGNGILQPGETWSITLKYYIEATDLDRPWCLKNTVEAFGSLCHATYSDKACWCIMVYHPEISIEKTANMAVSVEGHPIVYTINVTNTGDSLLFNVRVYDDMFGWFNLDEYQDDGTLNAGESWVFTIDYTIPDRDPCLDEIWEVCNTATAYADFCHATLEDTDCWCIDVVHPRISLDKSIYCDAAEPGDTVTYWFNVINTGDIELQNIVVEDADIGMIFDLPMSLAPGESYCFSWDFTIPMDIIADPFCNWAKVTGYVITDDNCHVVSVSDCDCAVLDIMHPRLNVLKFGPDFAMVGDIVIFSLWVQNTGDVPLSNVVLVDGCWEWNLGNLDIGQEKVRYAIFCITCETPDPFCNVAYATAKYWSCVDQCKRTISDEATKCVDIVHPSIDLVKVGPESIQPGPCGQMPCCIEYSFTITNNGDVPLTGVVLEDEMLGLSIYIGDLDVGQTVYRTACYELQDPARCPGTPDDRIVNKAVVTGFFMNIKVCDTDTWTTILLQPAV